MILLPDVFIKALVVSVLFRTLDTRGRLANSQLQPDQSFESTG
jgi:hypothetical protein